MKNGTHFANFKATGLNSTIMQASLLSVVTLYVLESQNSCKIFTKGVIIYLVKSCENQSMLCGELKVKVRQVSAKSCKTFLALWKFVQASKLKRFYFYGPVST